ncbi:MAG: HD domain-containing protein [Firmicutes bacterium]|nr:HD domain-containing protein [Bacillota bacterium]
MAKIITMYKQEKAETLQKPRAAVKKPVPKKAVTESAKGEKPAVKKRSGSLNSPRKDTVKTVELPKTTQTVRSTDVRTAEMPRATDRTSSTNSAVSLPNQTNLDQNIEMQKNDYKIINMEQVRANPEFRALISAANSNLEVMGYNEHGLRHVGYVSKTTGNILRELGFDNRTIELGAIAGFIHDIGNAINRTHHGPVGAAIAYDILARMKMNPTEITQIIGAIGNHEEQTGWPVGPISSALIIADKSDAHRSRVGRKTTDDLHGRVNMAIKKNYITVDKVKKVIRLFIFMDTQISATMEFLQIYITRMAMCEKAAYRLGCSFELIINKTVINRQGGPPSSVTLDASERNVSEESNGIAD